MADVYIVVFSVLGILITLPALLVACNLLLPKVTGRAVTRVTDTPGKSFVLGVPVMASFLLWIAIASQINFGPVQATAFVAAIVGMGIGAVGAAGMARLIGERLRSISEPHSELGMLVRGAVVYELACLFPIVGWFLFLPLVGVTVMGAAVFGFLGWIPKHQAQAPPVRVGRPRTTAET